MPFIKVFIHFVWSTKNRFPFLDSKDLRLQVGNHIRENAREKGIYVDFLNGHTDHCHCLVSLGSDQAIQKIAKWSKENRQTGSIKINWRKKNLSGRMNTLRSLFQNPIWSLWENISRTRKSITRRKHFNQEYDGFIVKYGYNKYTG